jgi:molybdopterin converting factor small subunit
MAARVRILLFATAREAVGRAVLDRPLPSPSTPVAEVLAALSAEYPRLQRIVGTSRVFRNGSPVRNWSEGVSAGDELAIHPPYSGG